MVRLLGLSDDLELAEAAEPILNPQPYDHPILGRFCANPVMRDLFEKDVEWNGLPAVLSLTRSSETSLDILAVAAVKLLQDQHVWQRRLQMAVIESYYEVWTDNWQDDDDPPKSPDEWISKMRVQTISIESEDKFSFWLEDGDLFHGHSLAAWGTFDAGFSDVELVG